MERHWGREAHTRPRLLNEGRLNYTIFTTYSEDSSLITFRLKTERPKETIVDGVPLQVRRSLTMEVDCRPLLDSRQLSVDALEPPSRRRSTRTPTDVRTGCGSTVGTHSLGPGFPTSIRCEPKD